MKKLLITLIFTFPLCGLGGFAFAQTKPEKLFAAMKAEFEANPAKALQDRAVEDYVLVSGTGYMANKSQVVGLFKNVKNVEVSFENLKLRQSGNTIIATGKEHSVRHYNDSTPDLTTDYMSSYVYEIKGNNLMYLSGQHTEPALGNAQAEEEKIKNMLRQETIDAFSGKDVDKYFVDSPSTFRVWNIRSGAHETDYGLADMKVRSAKYFTAARNMNPDNDKHAFQWLGNDAVVASYDQYLYGRTSPPSKEVRILKRVNGEWKLTGLMAFTNYTGHQFEQDNVRKTIEAETNAYHAGDVDLMDKQWAYNAAYVERQQAYLKTMGGVAYQKGDNLRAFGDAFKKVHKPTGQTYKISEYEAHVGPVNAWVTYSQEVFNADGKLANKSRELRVLERLNGWKIVMMSNVEM